MGHGPGAAQTAEARSQYNATLCACGPAGMLHQVKNIISEQFGWLQQFK